MNGSRRNTHTETNEESLNLTLPVGGLQPLAASVTLVTVTVPTVTKVTRSGNLGSR